MSFVRCFEQTRREREQIGAGVRDPEQVEQSDERRLVARITCHRLAEVEHEIGLGCPEP